MQWRQPQNVKDVRSFLPLTGYYRKFVKGYATISKPLTNLHKKDHFRWTEETEAAFQALRKAMTKALVLTLPNFDKQFEVEIDASNTGIGALLQPDKHPIAFISRTLGTTWQTLSEYEKELLVVFATQTVSYGQHLHHKD